MSGKNDKLLWEARDTIDDAPTRADAASEWANHALVLLESLEDASLGELKQTKLAHRASLFRGVSVSTINYKAFQEVETT